MLENMLLAIFTNVEYDKFYLISQKMIFVVQYMCLLFYVHVRNCCATITHAHKVMFSYIKIDEALLVYENIASHLESSSFIKLFILLLLYTSPSL